MNEQTTSAQQIAGLVKSSVSRRKVMQAAGLGGVALVAAACGAGGEDGASASASPASAVDQSATDKVANWSNWPLYLDVNDETGEYPSLKAFQENAIMVVVR